MPLVYSLLILLCFLSPALAKASPGTFYIPISVDEDAKYSVDVKVSNQSFRFLLTTGTGYNIVAGKDCEACGTENSYDASQSSSMRPLASNQSLPSVLSDTTLRGDFIKEDCGLMERNGSQWTYLNQTVFVANQSESLFLGNISYSGVFGLAPNARDGRFIATIYNRWLQTHPGKSNFSFGMALNDPGRPSPRGGFLHWVVPDASAFKGPISQKPMISATNTTAPTEGDFIVNMDWWSFDSEWGMNVSRKGGEDDRQLKTFLDPFFLPIVFPQSEAIFIYETIEGAAIQSRSENAMSVRWSVPCGTKMKLIFTFGDLSVTLDESALVKPTEDGCVGLLEHWTSSTVEEYLLGSAVVSRMYMIFMMSNNGSSIGFADRADPEDNDMETQVIVGISLGSVGLVIVLCGTAFMIYRIRKKRGNTIPNRESCIDPFILPHSTSKGSHEDDRQLADSTTPPISPGVSTWMSHNSPSPSPSSPHSSDWYPTFHQYTPPPVVVQPVAPPSPRREDTTTPSAGGSDNPPPPYVLSPSPQPQLLSPPPRVRRRRSKDASSFSS